MRLIHTSDVHLDTSFAGCGMPPGQGNWRRQRLRELLLDILRRAASWPADAVLIAGDLFELGRLNRETVTFLREAFELVRPIPVFIAPGNEDPFVPASPYAVESWPQNVCIFDRPKWSPHELEEIPLTVHGFGFDGPEPSRNPFGTLETPADGRVHVAVAHGAERTHLPSDKAPVAPFDATVAASPGFAYLALGHYHTAVEIAGDFQARVWYSGAPEGLGFHEPGPHHYLEIEIDAEADAPPRVTVRPASVSHTNYVVTTLDCGVLASRDAVVEALRALASVDGGDLVARVSLTGPCPPAMRESFRDVYEGAADAFTFLDLLDETEPAEVFEELAREHTSLGLYVRRLNQQLADTVEDRRRRMLARSREVGLAAYRDSDVAIRGVEGAPR
ncbi:MAG TPA: metallophosphoesterase [Candidatus Hydrogenedentes bacterium]|nr:metallophosphoesterase [Candidatus Hydrogenedentota bacterium]